MEGELFGIAEGDGPQKTAPLSERIRPGGLADFVGQEHVLGPGRIMRRMVETDQVPSLVLWGPPGSGKTTLARIVAATTKASFQSYSAVHSGVKEIREVINQAVVRLKTSGRRTILFVDEIHRFNKAQQDVLLPHIESGAITFIGATTENPSFEVISPLLSRCRTIILRALGIAELVRIMRRALEDSDRGLGPLQVDIDDEVLEKLAGLADGDARVALDSLELAANSVDPGEDGRRRLELGHLEEAVQRRAPIYDKDGEGHFNLISALHKSLRGSDPQGALYWLARMVIAGEDPLYIARRMVRFASEDVGVADPGALAVTIAARDSYHFLGSPEGELALAQAAVYLATAPKSNSLYTAWSRVLKAASDSGSLPPPLHIRNAPTKLMKDAGYSRGYKYDHDYPDAYAGQSFLPSELKAGYFYKPSNRGFEKEIKARMDWWEKRMSQIKAREVIPGFLITFEGIDGSGKSTQARLLSEHLTGLGYEVKLLREPTDGPWGRKIRSLRDSDRDRVTPEEELKLFIKDRRQNVKENILPALKAGMVVILDRYYFSSMAYQGALGIDPERIRSTNESFAPVPNMVVILEIDTAEAIKRIHSGREKGTDTFEGEDYLKKVKAIFDSLSDPYVHRFDAARVERELNRDIIDLVVTGLKGAPVKDSGRD